MVTSKRGPKPNGAAVEPRPAPVEPATAAEAGSASTLAQVAADQIRGAILSGAVAPGSKLHIQRLSAQFGLSATPIREGLTRLTSTGLVEALGQRGFRVQPISWKDLVDIQRMRHLVETEALRLAIEKGDLGWEQNIVGALHRLKALSFGSHEALPEGEPLFDKAHRDFHTALIAACDSPRLLAAHSELHDQVYRYRIVLRLVPRRKSVTDRDHAALARHALARDVEAAVGALHRHIDLTTQFLQQLPEEAMAAAFMQRSLSVASAAD